jgi:hypothetical protein
VRAQACASAEIDRLFINAKKRDQAMTIKFVLLTAMLFSVITSSQAAPFVISPQGDEVTDTESGLIWRRCAEGMKWSGTTCTGEALALTWEAAQARGKSEAAATKRPWRVPAVREWSAMIGPSYKIDSEAFPDLPEKYFWSCAPYGMGGFCGAEPGGGILRNRAHFLARTGGDYRGFRTDLHSVLLVRGGK